MVRVRLIASSLVVLVACTTSAPVEPVADASAPASKPAPAVTAQPPAPAPASGDEETLVADILETGPIGDGACVQRSYRVRAHEGGAEQWVHFERCGTGGGPDFGGLHVGNTYRFRLRRGASPNFGNEPMILAAEPVDP